MRVVIVGGGEIGFALAQTLLAEHEVFVVDNAPEVAARFEPIDVQFVLGTGTSADVLDRAGIAKADVLVACTRLDESTSSLAPSRGSSDRPERSASSRARTSLRCRIRRGCRGSASIV